MRNMQDLHIHGWSMQCAILRICAFISRLVQSSICIALSIVLPINWRLDMPIDMQIDTELAVLNCILPIDWQFYSKHYDRYAGQYAMNFYINLYFDLLMHLDMWYADHTPQALANRSIFSADCCRSILNAHCVAICIDQYMLICGSIHMCRYQ